MRPMRQAPVNPGRRPVIRKTATRLRSAGLVVFCAACLAWAAGVAYGWEPRVGLQGNSRCLWVYHIGRDPKAGTARVLFAVRLADDEKNRYRPAPLPGMGTRIARDTTRGDALELFFADGTHRSMHFLRGGVVQSAELRPETRLPKDAVPLAMAGDDTGVLYAVVRSDVARAVQNVTTTAPAAPDTEAAESTPLPTESGSETEAALAIVRYEAGRWVYDRDLPPDAAGIALCWLAAGKETLELVYSMRDNEGGVFHRRSSDSTWSEPDRIPAVAPREVAGLCLLGGEPAVFAWTRRDEPDGCSVSVLTLADREWTTTALEVPADSTFCVDEKHLAATAFDERVAIAIRSDNGDVGVGLWAPDGTLAEPPEILKALVPPADSLLDDRVKLVLPFVVLGGVLVAVLGFRRYAISEPADLEHGQQPARFLRRGGAFLLDSLLVSPLSYPILRSHFAAFREGDGIPFADERMIMMLSYDLFWYWLAAAAVFVIYCLVFEAVFGATPGKLVLRCRVVDERGRRPTFGRILVRNVVRFLELYPVFELLPSMVLIVLTPKKQRLGDMMAGTVVAMQERNRRDTTNDDSQSGRHGDNANRRDE
jgi:uncharacterized RDD family membrane protein YckC